MTHRPPQGFWYEREETRTWATRHVRVAMVERIREYATRHKLTIEQAHDRIVEAGVRALEAKEARK